MVGAGSLLLLLAAGAASAQEGQADLDKAMDLQDHGRLLEDLAEVAALCEKAIEKGLAKDDEAIARQLLTGALYQRASQMCQPLAARPR